MQGGLELLQSMLSDPWSYCEVSGVSGANGCIGAGGLQEYIYAGEARSSEQLHANHQSLNLCRLERHLIV